MIVSSEWNSEVQEGNLREGFREWRELRVKVSRIPKRSYVKRTQ